MNRTLPRTPLAFAASITKPYWYFAVGALIAVICGSILDGAVNIILKNLIDAVTVSAMSDVKYWALLYTATFGIAGLVWRCSGFFGMRWMTYSRAYAYRLLFSYLTHHSANYFNNRFAGALTNKIANVADGVNSILQDILWQFLPLLIALGVTVFATARANIMFAVIITTWVSVSIAINIYLALRKRTFGRKLAEDVSIMRGTMVDSASNIASVHQNAHQEFEIEHLQSRINNFATSGIRNWFFSEWILVTGNILQTCLIGITLWYAVYLLGLKLITVGDVVMIVGLMIQLIRQIFNISTQLNRFSDNYSQATEGLAELLLPHEIVDDSHADTLSVQHGKVEFRSVDFSYDKQQVFDDFSLLIEPGQKVGLVGHSGAGKTSLTSILLRQYDIQSGDIVIDDQNIHSITQKSLRHQIAIVPQDTSLFHRTIRENIRYGRLSATDDEVLEAAKLAQADTFIMATPKGYDTLVGERGVKLSGGQRQRIAIARAILKNAPILVLDEATSALDSESETSIQQALQLLMKGKTVIAIAHRLSTLRMMDRIIVLDKGKVVEDGTHAELVAHKGIYARLWESQVKGFIQE